MRIDDVTSPLSRVGCAHAEWRVAADIRRGTARHRIGAGTRLVIVSDHMIDTTHATRAQAGERVWMSCRDNRIAVFDIASRKFEQVGVLAMCVCLRASHTHACVSVRS